MAKVGYKASPTCAVSQLSQFHSTIMFFLLFLASTALASSFTESICLTYEGTKSVSTIPTSACIDKKTFTITTRTTITPSPKVYTSTSGTAYSTTTAIVTTTSQNTVTVPTSSGFTPIQSEIATQSPSDLRPAKRAVKSVPAVYPESVTCFSWIQILSTSTVSTTLKPSTSTVIVASTTITSTTTSTVTTILPSATAYAVCQPANYLHKISGIPPYYYFPERSPPYTVASNITDQETCCNACQKLGENCAVSLLDADRGCVFIAQDSTPFCNASVTAATFVTGYGGANIAAVMNGNCGQWFYDYNDSEYPTICGPGTPTACTCGPGTATDC